MADKLITYLSAERERLAGNYDQALALYKEVLAVDQTDWKIRECIADTLHAKGDTRAALKELFTVANRLIWEAAYGDANRILTKMLRIDPDKQFDITKDVQRCMDEVAEAMGQNPEEIPADANWEGTRDFFESLALDESVEMNVPDEILDMVDVIPSKGPPPFAPRNELTLVFEGGDKVRVDAADFMVGCAADCNLVLPGNVASAHQSRIVESDGRWILQGVQGSQATLCNGAVVDEVELANGNVISFGLSGPQARVQISGS
ncbi:MAG: FHA domain-containing protein [Acidobacteriota bacterium]